MLQIVYKEMTMFCTTRSPASRVLEIPVLSFVVKVPPFLSRIFFTDQGCTVDCSSPAKLEDIAAIQRLVSCAYSVRLFHLPTQEYAGKQNVLSVFR